MYWWVQVVQLSISMSYFFLMLQSSANNLVSTLWHLMESGLEELRILQTVILLITTSNIVHGDHLGKVIHNIISTQFMIAYWFAWCHIIPSGILMNYFSYSSILTPLRVTSQWLNLSNKRSYEKDSVFLEMTFRNNIIYTVQL
jgi:hypothetical protein